jgi:cytosine/adenosine deaminase-related metal-dependent hydrolase
MIDILIENCIIVTMDKERRIIGEKNSDGAIAIEGNKIVDVGTTAELRDKYNARSLLDAKNKVAMPGLIDCHGHPVGMFGIGEQFHPQHYGFFTHVIKRVADEETFYLNGLMTAVERIKWGTTCGVTMMERVDDPAFGNRFAEAVSEVGSKAIVAMTHNPGDDLEDYLRVSEKVIRNWHNKREKKIQVWLGEYWVGGIGAVGCFKTTMTDYKITQPTDQDLTLSKGIGTAIRELMDKYETHMHTHASQGQIKFAYKAGDHVWLGPDVLAAHCRGLTDEEIKILAKTGTKVAHCPYIYSIGGGSPMRTVEMIDAGVTVGLGSDHGIRVSYDLFKEMKEAMCLQRVRYVNRWVMPPGKILEMATIDGAKALGMDHLIGSIEIGKRADVILLNLLSPHLTPRFNIPSRIVYEADGHDVDTVIVDGKIIMENRKLKTVNEEDILCRMQKEAERMIEKGDLQPLMRRPRDYWGHARY